MVVEQPCVTVPFGLVVRISGFHPDGPGSIPGVGIGFFFSFFFLLGFFFFFFHPEDFTIVWFINTNLVEQSTKPTLKFSCSFSPSIY